MAGPEPTQTEELLDEESLAVLAILLAVSLEFGFGFAKTVDWWAGLLAGPAALATLITLFRLRPNACLAGPRRHLGRPNPPPPAHRGRRVAGIASAPSLGRGRNDGTTGRG